MSGIPSNYPFIDQSQYSNTNSQNNSNLNNVQHIIINSTNQQIIINNNLINHPHFSPLGQNTFPHMPIVSSVNAQFQQAVPHFSHVYPSNMQTLPSNQTVQPYFQNNSNGQPISPFSSSHYSTQPSLPTAQPTLQQKSGRYHPYAVPQDRFIPYVPPSRPNTRSNTMDFIPYVPVTTKNDLNISKQAQEQKTPNNRMFIHYVPNYVQNKPDLENDTEMSILESAKNNAYYIPYSSEPKPRNKNFTICDPNETKLKKSKRPFHGTLLNFNNNPPPSIQDNQNTESPNSQMNISFLLNAEASENPEIKKMDIYFLLNKK